jgi:class 3 adenylate cyclase
MTEAPAHRILVVDDNEMNRDMLSRRLRRRGFAAEMAEDGQQALDMIASGGFDLILLDVMMPGIDGMEVLRRLRERFQPGELPIIMQTAKDQSEDVVGAFKLGANDYVTKPIDFPVVLARVRTHLQLKDAQDELGKRNDFIRQVFGRYVTEHVVDNLLESPDGLAFGGARRDVTILMGDVRGFSSLCERLAPEQVVRLLNIYLGAMTNIVGAHGGCIDEFIGDAVLALFNAPNPMPEHRESAIRCGLAMQLAMGEVNETLEREGLPAIEMGIGVHSGECVVGNIGSDRRAKYGVVGSPVNLTGRVESFTVGGQLLVTRDAADGLADKLRVRREFTVEAKGMREPISL